MSIYDDLCENQCADCRGWGKPCPIAFIVFNIENEEVINLLTQDGKCHMLQLFKKELMLTEDEKNQLRMFE
jgi:hypothetical protein